MSSKFQNIVRPKKAGAAAVRQTTPKRGRPAGKRSDAEFTQVTAYIRKDTHRKAKIKLLEEGQGREFSELVEELVAGWLSK